MRRLSFLASSLVLAGSTGYAVAQPEPVELGEIVVTAAGFEQNISDAPASISAISGEELNKRSYDDISDAVKNIPGAYVSGGGKSKDITIRGMSGDYTLYLIDGRPVSSARNINTRGTGGGKQIALPPASMIERVEVIRGPMSSLYGSEAMGGVINIITKKTADTWSGTVSTEYTKSFTDLNEDEQQASVFTGGPIVPGLLSAQVNGSWKASEESHFKSRGGGKSSESIPERTDKQGGAKLILTPDDANEVALSYNASTLDSRHTPGVSIAEDGRPYSADYKKDVYALTHQGNFGNLMLNSYVQHDVSELVQTEQKKEEISTFNTQGTLFLGDHMLTVGGQYKYEDLVDETNGEDSKASEIDRWIAAVFAEVEWAVTDDLNVTTGLRYNDDELFGSHLSPRIYSNYHLTPEWTFKGGVSTGYKQPSLPNATEGFALRTGGPISGDGLPHITALVIGNEDLDPEVSTSYELGFVFDDRLENMNASVMLFYTDFKDKIEEDRFCDSGSRNDPSQWQCSFGGRDYNYLSTRKNIDKAMMRGVELTFDYGITDTVGFSSSYTFTDSEQKSGEFKGEPLNKIPKHMLNAGLDWQTTAMLNLWIDANIRGETSDYLGRDSMDDGTPGYGFVDAGLVYQLNESARVKAGLYNIGDKQVTNDTYGVVLDGRRLNLGLAVDF